jgi:transposase
MLPDTVEKTIARQSPEVQAIILGLLEEIAELKVRIEELERQVKGKTPQNSSLPPSTQHP